MAHSHTVHLPLGALLIPCTMCGTGGDKTAAEKEALAELEDLGRGLTPLMFQTALLWLPSNRARCKERAEAAAGPLHHPMTEYWVASSHNSYLRDADQLAGTSAAQ